MMRILEAQFIGNFANGFILIIEPFLCFLYHKELNGLLSRFSGFFLNQITKVIGRKMQFVRSILHRRQTDCLRLV